MIRFNRIGMQIFRSFLLAWFIFFSLNKALGQKRFRVLVLYENGGHHIQFSKAAVPWLNLLAADSNFSVDYIQNTKEIDEDYLSHYQLFLQLDYPPYAWGDKAEKAFQHYIEAGIGGWVGLHHASLLGEFDGYPIWKWYDHFMGGIRFTNYIPEFARAKVIVEDSLHAVASHLPSSFIIEKDEWYTYDKNPRATLHVIASVDESSYEPDSKIKMGDHPVIWTNPSVRARNIYIFMGHSPDLFSNSAYTTLLKNAIFWAAGK